MFAVQLNRLCWQETPCHNKSLACRETRFKIKREAMFHMQTGAQEGTLPNFDSTLPDPFQQDFSRVERLKDLIRRPGFESERWLWAKDLSALWLSFLVFQMAVINLTDLLKRWEKAYKTWIPWGTNKMSYYTCFPFASSLKNVLPTMTHCDNDL